jgi:hypothetical protein
MAVSSGLGSLSVASSHASATSIILDDTKPAVPAPESTSSSKAEAAAVASAA